MLMSPSAPPPNASGPPDNRPDNRGKCLGKCLGLGRLPQLGWVAGWILLSTLSSCGSPELANRASNTILAEPPPGELLPPHQSASSAPAASSAWNLNRLNLDEQGQALRGYDAVAYFTENTARLGSPDWHLDWSGATWLFSSAENRDRFAQTPERYAPAYGGYCTFGIVLRQKFDGDPEVWSIEGDRLHLFLNREIQAKFNQDKQANLTQVAQNWPAIRHRPPEALE